MNEVIKETLYFIISYIGIIFFFFFGVNWLSKGWLMAFIKVKASRGKKSFVICHGVQDTYYKVGQFDGAAFVFKDRDGKDKRITNITREDVIHTMGVTGFEYDVPSENLVSMNKDFKASCSPEETDNYIKRVIEAPVLEDKWRKIMIALIVVILLLAIVAVYFGYANNEAIATAKVAGVIQ